MWPYTQQCAIVDGAAGSNLLTVNDDKQALVLATTVPGGSTAHTPASGAIVDASTKTTLVVAPGAGLALALTTLSIWQAGALEGTVDVFSGTSIIARFPVTTEFGSGVDKDYSVPFQLAENELLALQCDAATAITWNVQTIEVGV